MYSAMNDAGERGPKGVRFLAAKADDDAFTAYAVPAEVSGRLVESKG